MPPKKRYWLFKSEPGEYSFDDLVRDGSTHWDGIRNYQVRNSMRDDMRVGDGVLFYHSNAAPPGVVGLAEVSREAYPDHTQFDSRSKKYDPRSDPEQPRWLMVDIRMEAALPRLVSLAEVKADATLGEMGVVKRGNRLSIQPVSAAEFRRVQALAKRAPVSK